MMKKRTGLSMTQKRLLMMWGMCGLLLIGAAGGTLLTLFRPALRLTLMLQFPSSFAQPTEGMAFSEVLGNAFTCSAAFLAAAFLLGFSLIGQPLALGLLLYLGGQVSAAVLILLNQYGRYGYLFSIGLVLPFAVCAAGCLIFAVRESLRFSGRMLRVCFSGEEQENMRHQLQLYCIRFLVLLGLLLLASVLYSAVTILLYRVILT